MKFPDKVRNELHKFLDLNGKLNKSVSERKVFLSTYINLLVDNVKRQGIDRKSIKNDNDLKRQIENHINEYTGYFRDDYKKIRP